MTGRNRENLVRVAAVAEAHALADETIKKRALQFRKDNPGFLQQYKYYTSYCENL